MSNENKTAMDTMINGFKETQETNESFNSITQVSVPGDVELDIGYGSSPPEPPTRRSSMPSISAD